MEEGLKRRLPPRYLEMLINSTVEVVNTCLDLGLECRDPPIASTALLYSLGYSQYEVRSLWSRIPLGKPMKTVIYKFEKAVFYAELTHEIEPICTLSYAGQNIPIDHLDAEKLRRKHHLCKVSPRTHTVRAYIRGSLSEHVSISVNVVRMLVLIAESMGKSMIKELQEAFKQLVWNYDVKPLERSVARFFKEHKYAQVLAVILPYVPRNEGELFKISPVIRNLSVLSKRSSF